MGNIHLPIGKVSFSQEDLVANARAVIEELFRAKPASAKGKYLLSAAVSSTMGPGIKLDPALVREVDELAVASA